MNHYLILRKIPDAGALDADELAGIAASSNEVIAGLGGRVQWISSAVSDDAIVCHYLADGEDSVREHARRGGFPADAVWLVRRSIDPTTADAAAATVGL